VADDSTGRASSTLSRADPRRDHRTPSNRPARIDDRLCRDHRRRRQIVCSAGRGDFFRDEAAHWANAYMWNDRMQGALAMTGPGPAHPGYRHGQMAGAMGGGHELALWWRSSDTPFRERSRCSARPAPRSALPDGRRDAILAAHHRRAAGARNDLLCPPLLPRRRRRDPGPSSTKCVRRRISSRRRSNWCDDHPEATARRRCA